METVYNKFNRGVIDDLATARDDVTRVKNSAILMENFIPYRLGPMQYRQGMKHVATVNTADSRLVPFFSSIDSTAVLQFLNNKLRIYSNDEIISSEAVTSVVTNGTFNSNITGWTTVVDTGAVAEFDFTSAASLTGTTSGSASIYQTITTQLNTEHTLRLEIRESTCIVMIGTSGAASDDIFSGTLGVGTHSIVFTPTANITITFENSKPYRTLIDNVSFSTTGVLELPTTVSTIELPSLRVTQSADVLFFTYNGGAPFRVERRGIKSWSITEYRSDDGPFGLVNGGKITLTSDTLSGNGTLTASDDLFTTGSVGTLYKVLSAGQLVTESVTAEDTGTNSIRITGVLIDRNFQVTITGLNGTGSTVTLQRSNDDVTWTDVESYTVNTLKQFNDELDNSILFYRLHVKTGDYSSGTIALSLDYAGGSIEGICRAVAFISTTQVTIQILQNFGSTDASRDWFASEWSAEKGYPTAVALYESRLWLAGLTKLWGSVIDDYTSFDDSLEGADAPISRTIGFGPVDTVEWLAISSRLMMGLASDEISVRSSSFGEVLTALNININSGSSQGVASVEPVRMDDDIIFVQRAGNKLYNLQYTSDRDTHKSIDLNMLNQTIGQAGVKRLAITRQPETRLFTVLNDGTVAIFNYDIAEDVKAWSTLTTNGFIHDVVVIPTRGEDIVYFLVVRNSVARLERLADFIDSCVCPVDGHVLYESPSSTLTGLDHLEGLSVSIWADSAFRGVATVSGGQISLSGSYQSVAVGLAYDARYESNKLANYVDYSVLTKRARVESFSMIARNLYTDGFMIGPSADNLSGLPTQENGAPVVGESIIAEYDADNFAFNGSFNTNSRVHIKASGPVTVMALVYDIIESKTKAQN